ncbi:MAG: FecR domain-containing protein [Candidatus Thiodiazotropha sp.]|jgi:hypothetical protein
MKSMKPYLRSGLFLLLLFAVLLQPVLAEDWVYRLHKGENLTLVAKRFLKPTFTPEQLQIYNGVLKDRQMPVGTEIRIPMDWMKQSLAGVKVRYVVGEASLIRRGSDEPDTIQRGDELAAGDRVVTAGKSAVSLEFADGSYLLLGSDSEVVFDALSTFKGKGMLDTRIRLQRGRLENRVKPLRSPGARYEIHTPAAVTVVRGTQFRIAAESDGVSRSEVTEGKVAVSAAGETVPVAAGEGTRIEPGQPPAKPRALLPAPDLSQIANQYTGQPSKLTWSPLAQAVAYRVQLMNVEETPLLSEKIVPPEMALPELANGRYELRVRGIDELGLEGYSASLPFEVAVPVAEPSPVISAPQLGPPVFRGRWFGVTWQPAPDAWGHRLLLARDPGFSRLLLDQLSQANAYWLPLPEPGTYYLAVDALYDASEGVRSTVYRIQVPGYP